MRALKISLLVFILSITISAQWEWKNPLPQANNLKKIFFTDSSSGWMVGDKGTFLKTVDASEWEIKYYDSVKANLTSVTLRNSNLGWAVSTAFGYAEEGKVFKTSDGGQSWNQVMTFNKDLYDVKFVSDDIGWVVGFGIISKTTDGGISWNDQLLDPLARFYSCYFIDSSKGWAIGYVGTDIYHTEDGGINWTQLNLSSSGIYFSITFSDNNNGWIVGQTTEAIPQALLYRSTDGGESWIEYPLSGKGLTNITFVEDSIGWITNEDGNIFRTSDGGNTWTTISSVATYINHIFFTDSERGWLVNPNGVIRKTIDGGYTWITQSSGFRFNIESSFFVDSMKGTIIQPSGTLLYTQDGAKTWTVSHDPPYADYLYEITFVDSLYGWVCGRRWHPYPIGWSALILKTTNGGQSWISFETGIFGYDYPTELEFANREIGFAGAYGIFRSTDSGSNWNNVLPNLGYLLDIFFLNSMIGWVTESSGKIFKTTNSGDNWEEIQPGVTIQKLFFLNENVGWGGNGSELLQTIDGGYTWQLHVPSTGTINSFHFTDLNNGWAAGSTILRTTDGGQNWERFWWPSEYEINTAHFVNDKLGWFTGEEGTILTYYNDEPSSIEAEEFDYTILNYCLSNNYPNPFNPITKIKYSIPQNVRRETGNVSLKIYDVLGTEIATLVNEEKSVGAYEVEFNAANLPSGIYFYQIKAGDYKDTKKMILLK